MYITKWTFRSFLLGAATLCFNAQTLSDMILHTGMVTYIKKCSKSCSLKKKILSLQMELYVLHN